MEQKVNAIILSLCLTMSSICGADNCDVAPIKKGAAAPCDGYFFNKEAENQAEQARDNVDVYRKLAIEETSKANLLQDENDVLQKRLNIYVQESKSLSQEKAKSDTTESLLRIGYFSLGVIVTALIARNVRN